MNTQTFDVTVNEQYPATVAITPDGNGRFAAVVHSAQYGVGSASGTYGTNGLYSGKVTLDGYEATFSAQVNEPPADSPQPVTVDGTISYGWFFSVKFSGKLAA